MIAISRDEARILVDMLVREAGRLEGVRTAKMTRDETQLLEERQQMLRDLFARIHPVTLQ